MSPTMIQQTNNNNSLTLEEIMNNYMNNNYNMILLDNELNEIFRLANAEFINYRKENNKLKKKINKLNTMKLQFQNEINNYNILKNTYLSKINNLNITNNENTTNNDNTINNENTTNNSTCCICMTNSNNFIYTTCGHMSCCQNCVSRLDRCPVCRDNNGHFIQVYNVGINN